MSTTLRPKRPKASASATRFSPYESFTRAAWAKLRDGTPMVLTDAELERLSGFTEKLSAEEVADIYLPLSRLINLHFTTTQELHSERSQFLRLSGRQVPFILGLAGSVAVGKSTTARTLQALLQRWPAHPRVALVTTDGFLLPNRELEVRGIMNRKGFPESYDGSRLLQFLTDAKAGKPGLTAPVYSHITYDIVPDKTVTVDRPDILIVEGLNVLQPARLPKDGTAIPFVSDFFDFSIYLDAEPGLIEEWYVTRFRQLRKTAFRRPGAYFHRYASLTDDEATARALQIWRSINLVNLTENILPTRQRADLILKKDGDHRIVEVLLRKI